MTLWIIFFLLHCCWLDWKKNLQSLHFISETLRNKILFRKVSLLGEYSSCAGQVQIFLLILCKISSSLTSTIILPSKYNFRIWEIACKSLFLKTLKLKQFSNFRPPNFCWDSKKSTAYSLVVSIFWNFCNAAHLTDINA